VPDRVVWCVGDLRGPSLPDNTMWLSSLHSIFYPV
jgi:hypothetical protein